MLYISKHDLSAILQRIISLENKVETLESERKYWIEQINKRLEQATETLEQKVVDKCYCRVYDRDYLLKLIEETDK